MTPKITKLLGKVSRGTAEASLVELFDILELSPQQSTLAKVGLVREQITELGLKLVPDIARGELDSPRRILFADAVTVLADQVVLELRGREAGYLELKSSLLYDYKRAAAQPSCPKEQLKSEPVLHSTLKTIAAFLTSGGGVLYVGVDNAGKILGIANDFECMTTKADKQNTDGWELILRTYIRDRFKDGETVNDYVACSMHELEGQTIARIEVSARKALSFVREENGPYALYRRQGNQTVQVTIDQVEEFLEIRRPLFS